ncbi:Putative Zinc finger C2H2-type [Colletotrichum destructivum]|uniref:Zinc finger C2H2-type n=1 Tax=Colletotrichum destructivum TaxID=34406 RepID=A0AAX4I2U7_9PEZI|nr:Putative Zinc finger C2H2-type [Colletotrichum destructivum]
METRTRHEEGHNLMGPNIAASANKCLDSFQECLQRASAVHARELSMVEDQVARFSTWATAMGVFAPERASMDHRLRYAPDVRDVVDGLLESLRYRVRACSATLGSIVENTQSESLSAQSEGLKQSFAHIGTEISHLNKISNTIRKASKETHVQKAADFRIEDEDGNDVEPLLRRVFEHNVSDCFPNVSPNIRRRLVDSMILRRKLILYRRHRHGTSAIRPQKTVPKAFVALPSVQTSLLANDTVEPGNKAPVRTPAFAYAASQVQSVTTLNPQNFTKASSSLSVVSESKTIALSNHEALVFPPAPGLAAKRKYEQLRSRREADQKQSIEASGMSVDDKVNNEISDNYGLDTIGEITCPYCLYALPAEVVFDERKWRNHVKNELKPYVCLFEDCDQSDILFTHSDEWRSHMDQHCRFWRCSSHRGLGSFSTREEYMGHMRQDHNTTLSDTQLRALANRNARKIADIFTMCPLCGIDKKTAGGDLESHITGHLRSLALKSLPSYEEEMQSEDENDEQSSEHSRQQSRSTIKNLMNGSDVSGLPLIWVQNNEEMGEPEDENDEKHSAFSTQHIRSSIQSVKDDSGVDDFTFLLDYPLYDSMADVHDLRASFDLESLTPEHVYRSTRVWETDLQRFPPNETLDFDEQLTMPGSESELEMLGAESILDYFPREGHLSENELIYTEAFPDPSRLPAPPVERPRTRSAEIVRFLGSWEEARGRDLQSEANSSSSITSDPSRLALRNPKILCTECEVPFSEENAYQKHMKEHHFRPYVCVFSFAGCPSTFASKNEWRLHDVSQHLRYWVCAQEKCAEIENDTLATSRSVFPNGAVFSRKDLYAQHVQRMHVPPNVRKAQKQKKPTPEWDKHLETLQANAERTRYSRLPNDMT